MEEVDTERNVTQELHKGDSWRMLDSEDVQFRNRWTEKLLQLGVEARGQSILGQYRFQGTKLVLGIYPVPEEKRTDRQFSKIFFIWFSMNFNILAYVLHVLSGLNLNWLSGSLPGLWGPSFSVSG